MTLKLKIPPPIVALVCVLLMWFISDQDLGLSLTFNYQNTLAVVLLLSGLLIDILALVKFKQAKTTVNPMTPENTSEIVTSGIYKFSRNPMYLGLACLLSALAVYFSYLLGFFVVVLFIAYITYFQILPEESIMEQHFGESYLNYKQKVRRWI